MNDGTMEIRWMTDRRHEDTKITKN
jgi:hypothetical protein